MSTLHVENLKGLSSGSNANKIIVPSGQTIDASAGTLVPSAGQIVQEVAGATTTYSGTTSTSYVASALSVTITPKFSTSLIILKVFSSAYYATGSTSGDYIYATIYRDSTNIGVGSNKDLGLYGAYGNSQNYARPFVFGGNDSPATTSSVVYKMYFRKLATGDTGYVNDDRFQNQIIATEIKQ